MSSKRPVNKRNKPSEDEIMNNILPSYQMFQNTVSRALDTPEEDYSREPPTYELSPEVSLSEIPSPFTPRPPDGDPNEFPFAVAPQPESESIEIWENTIIANVHKLKNLSKDDNKISKHLDIQLHVTEDVCQKGLAPNIIDPQDIEYKQGDYIHGYVTIENVTDEPFGFDMIYIVFEGELVVLENKDGLIDTQTPLIVQKFLNMMDLYGSWNYSNILRLTTDDGDPYDWCTGETDPYDGTVLAIDMRKKFMPGVKYKRFFSFKIPDKLLDDICEYHNLNGHIQLLPSLGFTKYNKRPSSLLSEKSKSIQDLSFLDTSINYHVACRIIGKSQNYGIKDKSNQLIIPCETVCPIRVIPTANYLYVEDPVEIMRYYKGFTNSFKERIEFGKSLESARSSMNDLNLTPMSSSDSKIRQLFTSMSKDSDEKVPINPSPFDNCYRNIIPYKKKTLMSSKPGNFISLSTPKTDYTINYVPPLKYRKAAIDESNSKLSIPLKIAYYDPTGKNLPEIKGIKAELIAGTFRTNNHQIPVEFCHDFFIYQEEFQNFGHKTEMTLFNERICNKHKKDLRELTDLIKKVGGESIQVDRSLYDDLKAMASLPGKLSMIDFGNTFITSSDSSSKIDIGDVPWVNDSQDQSYTKTFDLQLDVQNCYSRTYGVPKDSKFFDHITLVPDFQICYAFRFYYIRIAVKLANNDSLIVRVPIKVTRAP